MQQIIGVVSRSIQQFIYLAMLLMLFIFIYALLGMQIFRGNMVKEDGTIPRQNFDNFLNSFVTVF